MKKWTIEIEKQIEVAHQLDDTKWLLTKACHNFHGHGYKIKVKAVFHRLVENGMACDFKVIKNVLEKYDHKNLNDFFKPTTGEVFAEILHSEIEQALIDYGAVARSITVSLSETGKSWITYDAVGE